MICESDLRFRLLFTFLKKHQKKKIIVFTSSCASVEYMTALLNYIDLPVLGLHGKQKQTKRTATFMEFSNSERGVLICTDVAARGLDIPAIDWIIQLDPPDDSRTFIHRAGRTARAGKFVTLCAHHQEKTLTCERQVREVSFDAAALGDRLYSPLEGTQILRIIVGGNRY